MGAGACGCCESNISKTSEIHFISPKHRFSFFSFGGVSSRKIQLTEDDSELRVRLLKSCKSTKSLKLKVITEGLLPKGTTFIIHPFGLENSLRGVRDGQVFLGNSSKYDNEGINDICIPNNDLPNGLNEPKRNFLIFYHIEKDCFFIKDLGKGNGPFIKLAHSMVLKNNSMVNIGENFLTFGIEETRMGSSILTIKKFSENENGNIKSYEASDYINRHIIIGRKKSCDITIDDFLISKIQCNICYDINSGWILTDGDYQHLKESSNGTWFYLKEELEISNGMIFKINSILFQVIST